MGNKPAVPPVGVPQDPDVSALPLPDLPKREWKQAPDAAPAALTAKESFTIATYNVMADIWAPPAAYPHLPPWAVKWAYRGRLVAKEVGEVRPDVLCLQELGVGAEETLSQALTGQGYAVVYKQNPSGEGCAIYYKKDRFDLVSSVRSDYNTLSLRKVETNTAGGAMQEILCRMMFRLSHHNVFVIALLQDKITNQLAVVASTHLFWGGAPNANRAMQMMQAMQLLEQINAVIPAAAPHPPAVFLCGDFNSRPPPAETGLYTLLHTGAAPQDNNEWTMEGERAEEASKSPPPTSAVAVQLQLRSSYAQVLGKEPPYTHNARGFSAAIDYVYCSSGVVRPLAVLDVFSRDEMPHGLPTLHYAGDHILLCTRFVRR